MERLTFEEPFPELIKEGEKEVTWRVGDEHDVSEGDELLLCDDDGEAFAEARVTYTKRTSFGDLAATEWAGHERFDSAEELYKTYTEYYDHDIGPDTTLRVIRFTLI